MGFLDFLFAGAVLNSMKKARHNSYQPLAKTEHTHPRSAVQSTHL